MIKNILILICLLLLCSACVSRTTTSADSMAGTQTKEIKEKKLVWFWQDDYHQ
jgi:hypothetical protein